MLFSYYVLAEFSRYFIQDVSRELCNLSFIYFIMTTGLIIWSLGLLSALTVAKIILLIVPPPILNDLQSKAYNLKNIEIYTTYVIRLLERAFTFFIFVDSKFIGIAIFMIANYFTGITNIIVRTRKQPPLVAYFILFSNCLVFTFVPFFFIFKYRKPQKVNSNVYAVV
jgi:hypothetical protein